MHAYADELYMHLHFVMTLSTMKFNNFVPYLAIMYSILANAYYDKA